MHAALRLAAVMTLPLLPLVASCGEQPQAKKEAPAPMSKPAKSSADGLDDGYGDYGGGRGRIGKALAGGHGLLEGVPGLAKTLIGRAFAASMSAL